MHCDVYKFPKNEGWYVYIARPDYPNDTENLKDWLGFCLQQCVPNLVLGSLLCI